MGPDYMPIDGVLTNFSSVFPNYAATNVYEMEYLKPGDVIIVDGKTFMYDGIHFALLSYPGYPREPEMKIWPCPPESQSDPEPQPKQEPQPKLSLLQRILKKSS